jgi:hypothetical protein
MHAHKSESKRRLEAVLNEKVDEFTLNTLGRDNSSDVVSHPTQQWESLQQFLSSSYSTVDFSFRIEGLALRSNVIPSFLHFPFLSLRVVRDKTTSCS